MSRSTTGYVLSMSLPVSSLSRPSLVPMFTLGIYKGPDFLWICGNCLNWCYPVTLASSCPPPRVPSSK